MHTGKVFLIGAGPGDPDLLTLKALRRIQAADIIFYDALVNPEILAHARPGVRLVDVGKRGGQVSTPQMSIQAQLIRAARQGLEVVRLKGGDPFMFGRGGEECMALHAAGVTFEVVPGVTSGMAAAAYAGVPLTYRGLSQSVAFITGHEAPNAPKVDWRRMAQGADTLVIYMGVSHLAEISAELIAGGRSPETPAMAIQWGSTRDQRQVSATLAELPEALRNAGIGSPAILVIGAVTALTDHLAWFDPQELPAAIKAQA
ncbi:uroporphyrinogen-III C-methyltransferase [Thermithiobacillus plumbiphilus]|uniref:uroporphyrinogen-III C-methyltransferase n=1 Tax=Thermithiobacillus plumbiphilus TaxID=1729899 RepID=A0ABU9D7J3_9PROT